MSRPTKEIDTASFVGRVAAEIRRRREARKRLVAEVAERAGVPPQTWYNWERGRHLPLHALPLIAKALGCTVKDLVPRK